MKHTFYKICVLLLATVLIFAPLNTLFKTSVSADPVWTRLTDEDFADNTYAITNMVYLAPVVLFTVNGAANGLNTYVTGGDGSSLNVPNNLATDNTNNVNITGLALVNGYVYVSVFNPNDGDQLYRSTGISGDFTITFDNITEDFPDQLLGINYLASYGNNLFMSATIVVGGDGSENDYYSLDDEDSWLTIGTAIDFGLSDLFSNVIKTTIDSEGSLYIALNSSEGGQVWQYQEGAWTQVGSDLLSEITSFALFDGTLFLTTDAVSGVDIYRLVDGGWVENLEDWGFGDSANYDAKLVTYGDALYAFTSRYAGGYAEVYATNGSGTWVLVSPFIGEDGVDSGEEYSWTTSIIQVGYVVLVGMGRAGEGSYHATLWMFGDVPPTPDPGDGDDIDGSVEAAGPNSGDANNDMVTDATQANVSSFINTVTGHYVVLQSSCDTNVDVSMSASDTDHPDTAFNYPAGLMNFVLDCSVGETATVTQYYYEDLDASLVVARKFNNDTLEYTTIPGAVVTNEMIGGQKVVKIVYSIQDGGPLDQDNAENGVIVDPSGPALNTVLVPNTGLGGALHSY